MEHFDAALAVSSHVAHRLAAEHCLHTPNGNCAWYHGVWQYFRALGVMKTAGGSAEFFTETLRTLAARGETRRVLISGAADDAMSLVVLAAYRDARQPLDLTIVDRCETPLALTRWSAEQLGKRVTTHQADMLGFESPIPFDLVMTNSFLGAFDPAQRPTLFARWSSLLRPGGKVLFTNRLRPGRGSSQLGFTVEQARTFCAAVRRAATSKRDMLGIDPDLAEEWARRYADRYRSYPVRSVDEVEQWLRGAHFETDRIATTTLEGRVGAEAVAGPSVAERADYVRVLATRR